jgi:hypothetical protein
MQRSERTPLGHLTNERKGEWYSRLLVAKPSTFIQAGSTLSPSSSATSHRSLAAELILLFLCFGCQVVLTNGEGRVR